MKNNIKRVVLEYGEDYQCLSQFKTLKDAKEHIRGKGLKEFTMTKEYQNGDLKEFTKLSKVAI